jgi:flavodoxin
MRAMIVYESMFGNTEAIATAIGEGVATQIPVEVVEVGSAPIEIGSEVTLLIVGGPTHAFGMSRPRTRRDAAEQALGHVVSTSGIREWLATVTRSGSGSAVAFDTRVKKGWVPGSAARAAQRRLRGQGFSSVADPTSFYVGGTPGPLLEGEQARAQKWGEELAATVLTRGAEPQHG